MTDEPQKDEAAPATPPPGPRTIAPIEPRNEIEEKVVEVLREIYDPEIPVDIFELGLIYVVDFDEELKHVKIEMTLTSPSCPVAGTLPGEVETRVKDVDGVDDVFVDLVWDPPWTMERLSDAAKLQMGLT